MNEKLTQNKQEESITIHTFQSALTLQKYSVHLSLVRNELIDKTSKIS